MKKFIVPVDFSETSLNAARFAAAMTNSIQDSQIILYNVFDKIEAGSDGTPLRGGNEERKMVTELVLKSVQNNISNITCADISIVAEEDHDLTNSLERYVRHNHIDVIVMGITGATRLSQIMMGSNTLKIVHRKIAPVIIVPPNAQFTSTKKVAFISDLKNVSRTMPQESIKKMLGMFNASLHVLNVNSDLYIELTDKDRAEQNKLDEMLRDFNPEYSFMRLYDFLDAIDEFVKDNNIDLIFTVPKNDSFLSNLFKTTHTSRLAYHSHVPIVAIHS